MSQEMLIKKLNNPTISKNNVENADSADNKPETKAGRNSRYKREREKRMKDIGFINSKLYLGGDTYVRLSALHKKMLGSELPDPFANKGKKDIEVFSNLISYCIVKVYKEMVIRKRESSEADDIPDIQPAKTKAAQEIYNLYQRVSHQNTICAKSVVDRLNKDNVEVPKLLQINPRSPTKHVWTKDLVDQLLDINWLSELIRKANQT